VNFAPVSVENVNGFPVACTRNQITFVKTYGQLKEENFENQIPEPKYVKITHLCKCSGIATVLQGFNSTQM
jgi:hypothetical protein